MLKSVRMSCEEATPMDISNSDDSDNANLPPVIPIMEQDVIVNDTVNVLDINEENCHYSLNATDSGSGIATADKDATEAAWDKKLQLLPKLNVCRLWYLICSTFHKQRNVNRRHYAIVAPVFRFFHEHMVNMSSVTESLMHEQKLTLVDDVISPPLNENLSKELNNLNLAIYLSDHPESCCDNVDGGVQMMGNKHHVSSVINMCHELKGEVNSFLIF